MKRIVAIGMLMLLFFNWVGYQLYTAIAEEGADRVLIARLDCDQFSSSELISIRVSASHLSPYVNENGFERVNGQIEINCNIYNYVKRRIFGDSIEYKCIPNYRINQIRNAKEEFFKLVSDLQPGQTKKTDSHKGSFKKVNGQYFSETTNSVFAFLYQGSLGITVRYLAEIRNGFTDLKVPPPKLS